MERGGWEDAAHGFLAVPSGCLTATAGGVGALAREAGRVARVGPPYLASGLASESFLLQMILLLNK